MEPDYYSILEIKEDAAEGEVKKAYRRIAKKYHPDANPGDQEAEKKFKEAAEAYAVLGDTGKRQAYDRKRAAAKEENRAGMEKTAEGKKSPQQGAGFDFSSMSSNFEQFFGFRPGTSQVDEDRLNPNKKTRTNPIDMTEMFERYMGIKK